MHFCFSLCLKNHPNTWPTLNKDLWSFPVNIMKFECINVYLTGIFVYRVINWLLPEIFLSYFLTL